VDFGEALGKHANFKPNQRHADVVPVDADRAGSAQASDGARQEKNGWLIAPGLNTVQQSAGTHCTAEFRTGALNTPRRTRQWKSRSRTNQMGAPARNATSRNRA
jgi:hypothetical protein